tara:strand:+ start:933 stop:1478 length:546 start_codon:yes stop_codon:yes gene_type:complete
MAKKCKCSRFSTKNVVLILFLIAGFLILGLGFSLNPIQKYRGPRYDKKDVLLDKHAPPEKDGEYYPPEEKHPKGLPINIKTRGANVDYRQLGILTRMNGEEMILPLMGKPLYSNRSKWQYYTMTDNNNIVKLPISSNGRSCTDEYGCDELSNGDTVYVEGYNDMFKITVYDNKYFQYIPFL